MSINWSQEEYIKAYRFAAQKHQGQKFPGTKISYIMHLSFVSMEMIAALNEEKERDENLAIQCSLLHDTIEDTDTTFEELEAEFGLPVANGVLALSKDSSLEKSLQMKDSLQKIKERSQEIWMVKLADRITNLQAPPDYWKQDKIIRYREEAICIYETLKDASSFLASRLALKIEGYKSFINSDI
ncbi:HD domain-containing protein [Rivularia sp. UHCC 0363]|uniref:HD domain-containing protein n=1 Tax=Rivularia sp. UHCC 0363 TaxID=3110244 RepID=UPI002B20E698|nr:HD domain-containing protein [Rivularia sp. UHCC 0363]MEA5595765.1 HD domain-containing protein [Rivularia sp. UHCC 0363]